MIPSLSSFARAARQAHKERVGFTATQVVASDQLSIEAEVRQFGQRSTHVEFKTYQNPWTELEEALSGQVEFTGEELCGFTIYREGSCTWIYDPSTSVVLRKLGSHLYEPIPGITAIGELSFLDALTQDFLLRDQGEHPIGEMRVRRISIKPKEMYRTRLLSTVTFPIRSATIDFDTETFFPCNISILPAAGSPAASIIGPRASVVITYSNIQLLEDSDALEPYTPRADDHVFEESRVSTQSLADHLPFSVPLGVLPDHGFSGNENPILVTQDAAKERAYVTAHFTASESSSDEDNEQARLSITCGNYISRNMARRRVAISEDGTSASNSAIELILLDRSTLWETRLPGIDAKHAPVEAFFEQEGVFWFLSGTGMSLDSIQALAEALINAEDATT